MSDTSVLNNDSSSTPTSTTTPLEISDQQHNVNDLKDMTIADLLGIVQTHHQSMNDIGVKNPPPSKIATVEEKVNYALTELEITQRQLVETRTRYNNSMTKLQKATLELQNNNQLLLQNKNEIQENKIESQRTRIELNSLKQQTIDEIKNLNNKLDSLISNYNENFNSLHEKIINTLSNNLNDTATSMKPPPTPKKLKTVQQKSSDDSSNADSEFRYKLAKPLTNVRQIWKEYEYGLYGQPSVKSLDLKYKNRWRYKGENTTYLRRRKIFIAIENCIRIGVSEDDAIAALEKLRVDEETGINRTMAWLFDNIPDNYPLSLFISKMENGDKILTENEAKEAIEVENDEKEIEDSPDAEADAEAEAEAEADADADADVEMEEADESVTPAIPEEKTLETVKTELMLPPSPPQADSTESQQSVL